ncbi:BTAD domain-containing putative transcriptional regulator [Streptomyces sp. NPDC019443]|uniref:AfsR/SARP family transcriptional regulator n=1 Tax=Streptomyces sp. NPDC019443 TaxID=3365061 RepID=UPI0037B3E8FE
MTTLRLLGRFRLEYGGEVADVSAGGQRLLAYLGLRQHATRSVLAGTLWPEATEQHALGSLRTTLWKLHRERPPVVQCDRDTLSLADTVSVDVRAMSESALRVVGSTGATGGTGTTDADGGDPPLGSFLSGDLLPGWDEDWVLLERERLRQLRLHALESVAEDLVARGQHALALEAALESVRMEPLRESAHRAVVAVHLAEHNLAEALRHYKAFRGLLRTELGIEPSGQFFAMLRQALAA